VTTPTRSEAQRILDGAARRLLDARLEGQAVGATTWRDAHALENGADESSALVQVEETPIPIGLQNEEGVEGG